VFVTHALRTARGRPEVKFAAGGRTSGDLTVKGCPWRPIAHESQRTPHLPATRRLHPHNDRGHAPASRCRPDAKTWGAHPDPSARRGPRRRLRLTRPRSHRRWVCRPLPRPEKVSGRWGVELAPVAPGSTAVRCILWVRVPQGWQGSMRTWLPRFTGATAPPASRSRSPTERWRQGPRHPLRGHPGRAAQAGSVWAVPRAGLFEWGWIGILGLGAAGAEIEGGSA
jgi:hypothetical protein